MKKNNRGDHPIIDLESRFARRKAMGQREHGIVTCLVKRMEEWLGERLLQKIVSRFADEEYGSCTMWHGIISDTVSARESW